MLDRILVPLDGSALAECTLGHAVKLARAFEARVLLLWVAEASPEPPADAPDHDRWRAGPSDAQLYLSRMARLFEEFDVPVDTLVLEGSPAECTLELARNMSAELILLSTHRRTGMTPFPLSGTASKVLAAATDSVMVVRSEEGVAGSLEAPYGTVLAAVDLTPHSMRSARVAARVARSAGSELLLVTAVPRPELLGEDPDPERVELAAHLAERNRRSAERHLERLADELRGGGISVRWRVVEASDVARALERVAADEDVSLLVLGARGVSEDREWPHGAVAARLLERVDRPLLIFQEPEGASGARHGERPLAAGTSVGG